MSNMPKNPNRFLSVIIISVLCGLFAGAAGEIITRVYILKDFSIPYFNDEVNLGDINNRSNLIIRDAKKVVVNQDVKVSETIASIKPALIGFFKEINTQTSASSTEYYKLDEPELVGLTVTADGWVAISVSDEAKKTFNIKNYVAISNDRKVYKIDNVSQFNNLPGNLLFVHLESANNLSVKGIVSQSDITLGQSVLVLDDINNVVLTNISSFKRVPQIQSSDSLNARFTIAADLSNDYKNSFIFNLAGDLVAVVGSNKEVVPAFSYDSYWQSFFKRGLIAQPFLGVNYLDLSSSKPLSVNMDKGAWLRKSGENPAVLKGSPAELAGLKEGDIITWINNQEINNTNDLSNIISKFNPGETVTISYVRDGLEKSINVKLGEKK